MLDFGLAKAWSPDASGVTSSADLSQSPTLAHTGTAAGPILGTAAYMSPDQARGRAVDQRANIWAFGVLLWEMLTGLFTHPRDGAAWLQVGSIESDETRPLVRADSQPAYAAPGYVLYVREGVLLAQAFDAGRLRLTGEPQKLMDDVSFFAATGSAGFSVSQQGTLVVRHGRRPSRLAWFDRDGRDAGTLLGPGLYEQLALSPDGRRLAVSISDPRTGSPDIWLVDVERGVPSRFTSNPRSEMGPRWSRDGRLLAFSADWRGPPNVYVQEVASAAARELVPFDRRQQYPWDFTPDGASLLYSNLDEATRSDLWITDLQGKDRSRWLATEFSESEAALSPDGRRVAFTSDMTGEREVYLQSFPEGHDRVRVSAGGGYAPRWRGDGRELFYVTLEGQLMAAPLASGGQAPEGLLPRPLFRFDGHALQDYDVAPDGRRFLLNLGTGDWAGATVEQNFDAGISADVIVGWTRLLKR